MKKIVLLLLVFSVTTGLLGCAAEQDDTVFYYPRTEFLYHDAENVIVAEKRYFSSKTLSLQYLLVTYLVGPEDETLESPFPPNTRLYSTGALDDTLIVYLTDVPKISDARFSLGCACLAMTAMAATDCEAVTIVSGEKTLTITADDLLLRDAVMEEATEEAK